jgi:hypothetical protein
MSNNAVVEQPMSSKFYQNKDFIHIGVEILALVGVCYYVSNKNKTLTSNIEELSQRLEEQEDQIQKLDTKVNQLIGTITRLMQSQQSLPQTVKLVENTKPQVHKKPPVIQQVVKEPVVSFKVETESESEDDSDIDEEIKAELEELNKSSLKDETSNTVKEDEKKE